MSDENVPRYPKFDYNEYPKTLERDDFWGQTRRTKYGKRISEEEVKFLIDAINHGLALSRNDFLLDIACGNGALSSRLFDYCGGYLGVDASSYLIEIADQYFSRVPDYSFVHLDASQYMKSECEPDRFTKALCYASIQFFEPEDLAEVLKVLTERFVRVRRLFIGQIPDVELANLFFSDGVVFSDELNSPKTQVGRWFSTDEILEWARNLGWSCEIRRMPIEIFNSAYRFDVLFER